TSFDSVEISIALHSVSPDVSVKGKNTISPDLLDGVYAKSYAGAVLGGHPDPAAFAQGARDTVENNYNLGMTGQSEDASADDVAPSALIPGFYVAIPVNDRLAFGVAANSYFGLSSDYGNSYSGSEHAGETAIETMYLTPSVAYKLSDSISLGLGLQYVYGTGDLKTYGSQTLEAVTTAIGSTVPKGTTLLDLQGSGSGYGFQLGLMWDITETSSIGFRYQSEVEMEMSGDIEYLPLAAVNGGSAMGKGSMTVDLPSMIEVGYSNQLTDSWAIHGTILYTGWSSFENLTADIDTAGVGEVLLKDEMWDDAFSYSLGVDYTLNDITTLRAGIAYDESPVSDEHRSLTIPDADRMWYSIGATFNVGTGGSIDASILYIDGDSADVNETFKTTDLTTAGYPTTPLTEFEGELGSVSATIFSLGYNHKF
ncbi:MAG: outer membrane protein transport protein, partial [Sinobacterium sp.]|nr:outer membrane protein transport protein [Sinobacterium sp.]